MKKKAGKKKSVDDLRKRAEKQLKSETGVTEEILGTSSPELIHELEVHQIELEMQNEELRRTQVELTESRNRYYDLYDFAPVGYFSLDQKGLILEVNLTGANLLSIERRYLIKKRFAHFVVPDYQDVFHMHQKEVFNTKGMHSLELKLKKKGGAPFYAQLETIATHDAEGNFTQLRTVVIDITEKRQIQEEIRRQKVLLESINRVFQQALLCETGEEIAQTCLNVAEEITGSQFGFIGELNASGLIDAIAISNPGWDACKMAQSKAAKLICDMKIRGIYGSVVKMRKAQIINDPGSHPDRIGTPRGHPKLTSFLGIPFKAGDKTIGMIGLGNKKSGYNLLDQQNIEVLSLAFMQALERIRADKALQKSHDELEQKINERTAALKSANEQLTLEIIERKQAQEKVRFNESRLETLLKLSEMAEVTVKEIADFVCEEQVKLTQSTIGFLGFMNHDESVLNLHAYSKSVMKTCTVTDAPVQFPINKAGIWGEVVRKKEPLILNDYSLPNPYKRGYPEGHVRLLRIIAFPVMDGKRVVAIATVGNKETDYNEDDLRQLKLLMEGMREIVGRKEIQDELKQSEMQLQSLSTQLLTSQESERKRVAQELHDSVGQTLSALKFRVENAIKQLGEIRDNDHFQSLESLLPQIQDSIIEVNRIGRGLRPSMLDDLGVLPALSWFCREFSVSYPGIHINQQIALEEDDIPDNCKVVIYRILQEGLNNVAKHSKANLVELFLNKTNTTLEFFIKDNGKGFNLEHALLHGVEKNELGLAGMMKRVEMSGGVCKITSEENKGTQIKALWQI